MRDEKKRCLEEIKSKVVSLTDSAFHVSFSQDSAGQHIQIMVEVCDSEKGTIFNSLKVEYKYRIVVVRCPLGYIKAFKGAIKDLDEEVSFKNYEAG